MGHARGTHPFGAEWRRPSAEPGVPNGSDRFDSASCEGLTTWIDAIEPLVSAVIGQTAKRYHLSADDREELRSYVFLKLIEDDGRRLKRFRGESSFRTYLVVVIKRLYIDLRIRQRGRWRPSATAQQGGAVLEKVEQLIYRDGYSAGEAYEYLTTNLSLDIGRDAFDGILGQLRRQPSPTFETGQDLDAVSDNRYRADASLDASEKEQHAVLLERAWDAFAETLTGDDRLIWALHFDDHVKSARIAQVLRCPVENVYTRVDRLKQRARRHFENAGITPALLRSGSGGE